MSFGLTLSARLVIHAAIGLSLCAAMSACTRSDHAESDEAPASTTDGSETARAYDAVRRRSALLLDVRTRQEFEAERIEDAHNIPAGEIAGRITEIVELAGGKDKPVVVYCSTNACSLYAKTQLTRLGFQSVLNAGTVRSWPMRAEIMRGGAR